MSGEELRERILGILEERRGYVSGEEIASLLGITRSAVWKHVRALAAEGAEIQAGSRGYRLIRPPDRLLRYRILAGLRTERFGRELHLHALVDSTNELAKHLARAGAPEGTVVCAERQSAGRGRMGRSWHSPPGGLWFSLVLRPLMPLHRINLVSLMLGLGVAQVVEEMYALPAVLKWPNDVMVHRRKVCGVLVETEAEPEAIRFVVAGVGVNANPESLPEELGGVSLHHLLGRKVDRCELLAGLLNRFEELYGVLHREPERVLEMYSERCSTLGRRVRIEGLGESITGTALSLGEDGSLLVETPQGVRRVSSGMCVHLRH